MDPSLESIWFWAWLSSEIWTCLISLNVSGRTYCTPTWIFNRHVYFLGTWELLWNIGRIFGCSLTWHTRWLDNWNWRKIFVWMINGNSTCIPNWSSKYWSCAWLFVLISGQNDPWHVYLNTLGYSLVYIWQEIVNYYETSIGSIICSPVDLSLGTLIGTLMEHLVGNYIGSFLESFLGFCLCYYLVHL